MFNGVIATLVLSFVCASAPPNVVLLSVDTLRADHLGCYGYRFDTSPHIDRLAESGRLFEDAVCEIPLTAPSMGAMLTSRYPRATGLVRNGLAMPSDVPTVAEVYQRAGYQTFAVQSNWTLKADLSNLHRGFDTYDDDFNEKRWGLFLAERDAKQVAARAIKLLAGRDTERPFFAWFHFSDPHAPYKRHSNFKYNTARPYYRLDEVEKDRERYDSEIGFTDFHMGRVLEALPKDNTFIVFVADHGESLHEHDYVGHGRRIYQPGMHIPLIIAGPGIAPGREPAPVRGIDIGVTLLGLAGLPPLPGMEGLDLIHAELPAHRPRVIETYGGAVPKIPGAEALLAGRPPMRQGAIEDGWKLILRDEEPELFYLPEDPDELENRSELEPERVEALRARIDAWEEATESGEADSRPLTEDDLDMLESLGYL